MEPAVIRSVPRGRKRRRKEIQNVSADQPAGSETKTKKPTISTRSKAFVGRYMRKKFEGSGVFLGKIVYYDSGLYRVDYEDGDCEDLESGEVREFLIEDDEFDDNLLIRKKKLDGLVSKKSYKLESNAVDRVVEVSSLSELSCCDDGPTIENDCVQVDGYADSSSDSCEHVRDREHGLEAETSLGPPPLLPPSSGTIGVPDEYVSHLFSVYSFLRSFSIRLFLSPFGLDDFVGSLNCRVANSLVDAVHVALMRVLRRHLENLSSDGSDHASKCLRCIDWSLLDTLTWPIYLVEYIIFMGYCKGPEWKGFYTDVLEREYYTLPASKKLMILQILCDDVLDSAELRAEIDMREESEVGIDSDVNTANPLESGPRRVHPKYAKTSACKDQEAMDIVAESHTIKAPCQLNSPTSKGDAEACDVDQDANSDECRICGMDGTLLCCDGCPSAYHSRCIGVSKMFIPDGSWFCPECMTNKIGPTITMGTSLRGAEIFGIDSYGQLFLSACGHLLMLKASVDTEPCLRYYNQNDIPKVVQALHSSVTHTAMYSGICKTILQYWKIPENILVLPEKVEGGVISVEKVDALCPTLSLHPSGKENHNVQERVEGENFAISANDSNVENVAVSCIETLDIMTQDNRPRLQSGDPQTKKICPLVSTKLSEQIKIKPTVSIGSVGQQAGPLDLSHQRLADRSSVATCTSINSNSSDNMYVNGSLPANMPSKSREVCGKVNERGDRNSSDEHLYMGSSFKCNSYFNHYSHGDFAASAAANLAIILSEENQVVEAHVLDNPRKVVSANTLLQVKAFSMAANRFFWPNPEKKLVEVPRERCGWCLSCKAPATSRKACLLNSAALNAIRGTMKILDGLRPLKNGEGRLPSIATYILYMEERLRGLTVGPFLSASYRRHWSKQVEQGLTFNTIKSLLLELEENIRIVALSADWVKLVDNWPVESSAVQNTSSSVGPTQKRGPGRRSKKQAAISEVSADGSKNISKDFTWWRGGKLSKYILQKGILPRSMVKKAARQGGKRNIPGILYAEGSELPRRSRQFLWRAAVEMSNSASQLALQVRYLDLHVKWSDLNRPEQNIRDLDTEASVFRNALICGKKVLENKIMYGVVFGNQKHLPSRVMKNSLEVEQSQDGKEKYWFSEMRVPLYLIREYEANAEDVVLPSAKKALNGLSKLQRRQLKASHRDVFSYLRRKSDNWDKCSCASCQMDVTLGSAVECSACQGYCHRSCTRSSTCHTNGEFKFLITCKQCYDAKALTKTEISNGSSTSPLLSQAREHENAVTITKGSKHKGCNQPLASLMTLESSSEMKPAAPDSSSIKKTKRGHISWGIIRRKNKSEDEKTECIRFRLKNILLKGDPNMDCSKPVCLLCHSPYNSDLMYIYCETCQNWYHGDALELEESKIPDVIGFKCCKCRRIKSPVCPYMDPESKKTESRKIRIRTSKQASAELNSVAGTISGKPVKLEPTTPMLPKKEELFTQEVNPLIFSPSQAEQMTEHSSEDFESRIASGPGLQKLPVRRHVKREGDADGFTGNNSSHVELSIPAVTNNPLTPKMEASSPIVEWDVSINGFEDRTMVFDYEGLNYEDMEFEPQTYFSFTELLASEEDRDMDGDDASVDVLGNLENSETFLEPNDMGNNNDKHELVVQPAISSTRCHMCECSEPCPDLSCQVCGLWIHSGCSPWGEFSSVEDDWKCGSCREWR